VLAVMDFFSKERSCYLGCRGYWDANILVLPYWLMTGQVKIFSGHRNREMLHCIMNVIE